MGDFYGYRPGVGSLLAASARRGDSIAPQTSCSSAALWHRCFLSLSPAIRPGSRACARGSRRAGRWPATRWTRRTCRAGDRRRTALAASAGGVRLRAGPPVRPGASNDDACTPSRRTCSALTPVLAKQRANLLEDFGVELGRDGKRVGAGDGGEVLVAQLELDGAGVQARSRASGGPPSLTGASSVDSSCSASAVSSL